MMVGITSRVDCKLEGNNNIVGGLHYGKSTSNNIVGESDDDIGFKMKMLDPTP